MSNKAKSKEPDLKTLPPKWFAVSFVFSKQNGQKRTDSNVILVLVSRTEGEAYQLAMADAGCVSNVLNEYILISKGSIETDIEVSAEHVLEFYNSVGE